MPRTRQRHRTMQTPGGIAAATHTHVLSFAFLSFVFVSSSFKSASRVREYLSSDDLHIRISYLMAEISFLMSIGGALFVDNKIRPIS